MNNAPHTARLLGELLTVAEVAASLRITDQAVRKMIADGRLAAMRVGRHWRINRIALDMFIAIGASDMSSRATLTLNNAKDTNE